MRKKGRKGFAIFVKVKHCRKTSTNVKMHCKLANLP